MSKKSRRECLGLFFHFLLWVLGSHFLCLLLFVSKREMEWTDFTITSSYALQNRSSFSAKGQPTFAFSFHVCEMFSFRSVGFVLLLEFSSCRQLLASLEVPTQLSFLPTIIRRHLSNIHLPPVLLTRLTWKSSHIVKMRPTDALWFAVWLRRSRAYFPQPRTRKGEGMGSLRWEEEREGEKEGWKEIERASTRPSSLWAFRPSLLLVLSSHPPSQRLSPCLLTTWVLVAVAPWSDRCGQYHSPAQKGRERKGEEAKAKKRWDGEW